MFPFQTAIDRQRHSNGNHGSYIGKIKSIEFSCSRIFCFLTEPLNTGQVSHRNDDLFYPNRSARNHTERGLYS
jgi:hypothetical protein